jgi:hypothetical protein
MIGQQRPLILIPRYTSYMGAADYVSAPIDVTAYSDASVTVWRGRLLGTTPTFKFYIQLSTDAITWTDFDLDPGVAVWIDPGQDLTRARSIPLLYRFLRAKVTTAGTGVAVSCWATGLVVDRVEP